MSPLSVELLLGQLDLLCRAIFEVLLGFAVLLPLLLFV